MPGYTGNQSWVAEQKMGFTSTTTLSRFRQGVNPGPADNANLLGGEV